MAFLGTTFDANTVAPSAPRELLPAGKYHVQIINSEMRDTSKGGQMLWLEMSVMDGQYANQHLFTNLNLINSSEKAVEIAQRTLSAICHATGQLSVSDSEQLHHRSLIAIVKVRPAGPDQNGVMREAQNEIGGYQPLSGNQAPAAASHAAPVTQGGAPAAAVGAAKPAATPPWRRTA